MSYIYQFSLKPITMENRLDESNFSNDTCCKSKISHFKEAMFELLTNFYIRLLFDVDDKESALIFKGDEAYKEAKFHRLSEIKNVIAKSDHYAVLYDFVGDVIDDPFTWSGFLGWQFVKTENGKIIERLLSSSFMDEVGRMKEGTKLYIEPIAEY